MPIKLNGATSGSVELDVPAVVGSDLQLTLPATAGTALVAPGSTSITVPSVNGTLDRLERAGNILQVVQGSTSTEVAVGTTTFTDTTLSASITPSSSSNKILVIVNQMYFISRSIDGQGGGIRILRDSTVIHAPTTNGQGPYEIFINGAASAYERNTITKLDSPATTSSITYKTQGRPFTVDNNGSISFNVNNGTNVTQSTSYITLVEVAV